MNERAIRSVSIHGFKNILASELELAPLTVLIGPNNSGKSNFLAALQLMSELHHDGNDRDLRRFIEALGGPDIISWEQPRRGLSLAIERTLAEGRAIHWSIELDVADVVPARVHVQREWYQEDPQSGPLHRYERSGDIGRFNGDDARVPAQYTTASALKLGGVKLPATLDLSPRELQQQSFGRLPRGQVWQQADIVLDEAARGGTIDDADLLASDGRNLHNAARAIEQVGEGLEPVRALMAPLLRPTLGPLKRILTQDKGGFRWVVLDTERRQYRLAQLSHGTVRLLTLALLLEGGHPLDWVGIDEPELNLHPAWARRLAKKMVEVSTNRQLIVSTHSPEMLDEWTEAFRAGDVAVLRFDANKSIVERIDPAGLIDAFEEGWQLGDLYRIGDPTLGGWAR